MLITFAVAGYRSLREVILPLGRLNVVTGANGSGKSSLYRALRLLADAAQGRIIASLAAEGGLQSTLWAGPESFSRGMKERREPVQGTRRSGPISLKLGFANQDYGYAIDLGLPAPGRTVFNRDPVIKAEAVWTGEVLARRNLFASRTGAGVHILDDRGHRQTVLTTLAPHDSMMTHAADPRHASELLSLREEMRAWRFYDHFRTDRDAPARLRQVGTRTTALASDGADLAAALQTIIEIGDARALTLAVHDAFPGAGLAIDISEDGWFEVGMRQEGLLRPLRAAELSDGTLRYLLLIAALLSPRPPPLFVLNEPETSLHPELLAPLARLITVAAADTQVIVVSHARALVEALAGVDGANLIALEKDLGETVAAGVEAPAWAWPAR